MNLVYHPLIIGVVSLFVGGMFLRIGMRISFQRDASLYRSRAVFWCLVFFVLGPALPGLPEIISMSVIGREYMMGWFGFFIIFLMWNLWSRMDGYTIIGVPPMLVYRAVVDALERRGLAGTTRFSAIQLRDGNGSILVTSSTLSAATDISVRLSNAQHQLLLTTLVDEAWRDLKSQRDTIQPNSGYAYIIVGVGLFLIAFGIVAWWINHVLR